jgi:hypothetical protein
MRFEDCKVGMAVVFGRGNGEYTRGTVVKVNRVKAKVQTAENRGQTTAGTVWSVPYSLMEPENGAATQFSAPVAPAPVPYSPFQDYAEQLILEAINCVYSNLSPENLTCDGEASAALISQKRSKLNRQLRGLCQAFGRDVDESTAYKWMTERNEYNCRHNKNRTGTNG